MVCSITIPSGVEFKLTLPDALGNICKLKGSQGIGPKVNYMLQEPVWTVRNQKITRVYYRKNKSPRPPSPNSQLIFEDSFFVEVASAIQKRSSTPVVAQELRRSKRIMNASKGFKSPTLSTTKGKIKGGGGAGLDDQLYRRVRHTASTFPLTFLIYLQLIK
jgi:hypothetical protein